MIGLNLNHSAWLVLEDGTCFTGYSIGVSGCVTGEVVFNTSHSGYQEILTDPSYSKQIINFTYPHIGNTGINACDHESSQVYAAGLVVRERVDFSNHFLQEMPLKQFLTTQQVVGIAGVDTRHLTHILREKGAMKACLVAEQDFDFEKALEKAQQFSGLDGQDLASQVTSCKPYLWDKANPWSSAYKPAATPRYHIVVYDFGVKHNILRLFVERGCHVEVVPANTPATQVLAKNPDGIFLSNGPGDPKACLDILEHVKLLTYSDVPLFGICLGYQLLALALNAKTHKMKFGHHGGNHPVQDMRDHSVLVTSQNHGFAVDADSLPDTLEATHHSLFDGTLQGFRHRQKPILGFQGHPEASPGPHDAQGIFNEFMTLMEQHQTDARSTLCQKEQI